MPNTLPLEQLLACADTSWTTARGITRHWRRQGLVVRAFERRTADLRDVGNSVAVLVPVSDAEPPQAGEPADDVLETVLALAVDRPRRRLRADLVDSRGEELRADLLVVDGDTFWARQGAELLTNGGNVDHGHGGGDVAHLLSPSRVLELFDLTVIGETEVAGRRCLQAHARRRPPSAYRDERPPFAMIAGGDDFRLAVDHETGVLVQVEKVVDGEVAEVTGWRELVLDEPLPDELFTPPR